MLEHNGNELLNDICDAIEKYCVLPGSHEYIAITLWCAYTHFADAFDYAPRLIARSPHKRSGKTRLLEVIAELVRGPLRSINTTTPYVFRALNENPRRTLIFDEVDALFGTKVKAAQNEDLRALLNAGFQRGNPVGRTVGAQHTPKDFETFAPVALAGIGRLPDTIEDRAIVIPMRRKSPHEKVDPYRAGRDRAALHVIREALAAWAEDTIDDAKTYANDQRVDLPVDDRAADVWEPLLIVAELAGENWPFAAREAYKAMAARAAEDDTDHSLGQQLLADIHAVFDIEFMASTDLCSKLKMLPESPWFDEQLNPHRLGSKLREYGIKSRHSADKTCRGYRRADFADAWARYLPEKASKPSEVSDTSVDQRECWDTSPDAATSQDTSSVPDTFESPRASHQNTRSEHIPDASDASFCQSKIPTPLDVLAATGKAIIESGKYRAPATVG